MLPKDLAIRKVNELAGKEDPFLFIVDFNMDQNLVLGQADLVNSGILYDLRGRTNSKKEVAPFDPTDLIIDPVSFPEYKKCFDKVQSHLTRGDTYLINLTFPSKISSGLSLEEIYQSSHAPYKIMIPDNFVCFSPETFIRINDGTIHSYPMKGTIDASVENAADRIISDKKELYEHNTIVDLLRNDLSMVSTGVEVTRFRYIEEVRTNRNTLLQVSSEITGILSPGWQERLGEILFTLLPAGSVTGAPKKKTVEIIRAVETYDRGFYTGIFGYFDGRDLDSAVSIRFIEKMEGEYYYKSGGGITTLSRAEDEYKEMIEKVYVPVI